MLDSGDIQENSQKKRHEMILKKDVAESDDIKPAGGGRECWPSIEMIRRMFQKSKLMFLQEEKKDSGHV